MNDQRNYYAAKLAYEIDSWDLKMAMEVGTLVIVVDARSADAYAQEHIPGAINIPHRMMNPASTNQLSKDALIVTYCDGIGCNASTKGALNMLDLGFRVQELLGGLDWWKRDGHHTSVTGADKAPAACTCR